jgi:hypothetical protein
MHINITQSHPCVNRLTLQTRSFIGSRGANIRSLQRATDTIIYNSAGRNNFMVRLAFFFPLIFWYSARRFSSNLQLRFISMLVLL